MGMGEIHEDQSPPGAYMVGGLLGANHLCVGSQYPLASWLFAIAGSDVFAGYLLPFLLACPLSGLCGNGRNEGGNVLQMEMERELRCLPLKRMQYPMNIKPLNHAAKILPERPITTTRIPIEQCKRKLCLY